MPTIPIRALHLETQLNKRYDRLKYFAGQVARCYDVTGGEFEGLLDGIRQIRSEIAVYRDELRHILDSLPSAKVVEYKKSLLKLHYDDILVGQPGQQIAVHSLKGVDFTMVNSAEAKKCWHCETLTHWYEIDFGAWLCSTECAEAKWQEFVDDCTRSAGQM